MKKLLLLALCSTGFNVYANTFNPTSGMELKCEDSVSSYVYLLKITDIGDEAAEVKYISRDGSIQELANGEFFRNSEESYFLADDKEEGSIKIAIPHDNLDEAYYADGADSRALDCVITKF